jgi:acyl carrier protein/seryl-tRNA synthetase
MTAPLNTSARTRDAVAIRKFEFLDQALFNLALELGAQPLQFPSLVCRSVLEKAEYPKAFPHLILAATPVKDPSAPTPQLLNASNLGEPHWCLSPAVCYHAYAHLAGQKLDSPTILTARGRCFRHEDYFDPGRRQLEFEMREIILIGPADWVSQNATAFKDKLTELMIHLNLPGDWQGAQDPFFMPVAKGQALMQQIKETKLEYCTPGPNPLALASVNRHADFFGRRFDIRDDQGQFAHTACLAAGLDRWCHTLAQERQFTSSQPLTPDDILSQLAAVLPGIAHSLQCDQPLRDAGIDSIDLVDLLFMVESQFNVRLTETDMARARTIGDLAQTVLTRLQHEQVTK